MAYRIYEWYVSLDKNKDQISDHCYISTKHFSLRIILILNTNIFTIKIWIHWTPFKTCIFQKDSEHSQLNNMVQRQAGPLDFSLNQIIQWVLKPKFFKVSKISIPYKKKLMRFRPARQQGDSHICIQLTQVFKG